MQITIYRATQIGGQITRISTANTSIIIDLGLNLISQQMKTLTIMTVQ